MKFLIFEQTRNNAINLLSVRHLQLTMELDKAKTDEEKSYLEAKLRQLNDVLQDLKDAESIDL